MIQVTNETFGPEVLESKVPVLADFWASWCGPCRMMTPLLEELSQTYKVVGVNSDDNMDLCKQYKVSSLPTFIIFKNGEIHDFLEGVVTKDRLVRALEE